jgi:hypothetical protein
MPASWHSAAMTFSSAADSRAPACRCRAAGKPPWKIGMVKRTPALAVVSVWKKRGSPA